MHGQKESMLRGIERLRDLVSFQSNAVSDGMDIEILSDRAICFDGCTRITEFTDNLVGLESRGMTVIVEGNGFEIYTYADGRIRASGRIDKIVMQRRNER